MLFTLEEILAYVVGMVEVHLEKNRAGCQGERIQAEALHRVSEVSPDLRGLVERHTFEGLHHTLHCYSTPRRLSFLTVRGP